MGLEDEPVNVNLIPLAINLTIAAVQCKRSAAKGVPIAFAASI